MSNLVKLKMVAGGTYMCPPAFGSDRIVVLNEVVEVSEEHAAVLLDDSYFDASNNEHFYFKAVEDNAPVKPAVKGTRTRKSE